MGNIQNNIKNTEKNTNIISSVMNKMPSVPPVPEKPLDKVKPPTRKSRSMEREDR